MMKAKAAARAARAGAAGGMEPIGRLHDGHAHDVAIALLHERDRHDRVTPSAAPNVPGYERDDLLMKRSDGDQTPRAFSPMGSNAERVSPYCTNNMD